VKAKFEDQLQVAFGLQVWAKAIGSKYGFAKQHQPKHMHVLTQSMTAVVILCMLHHWLLHSEQLPSV
jgi:hypothetical protein